LQWLCANDLKLIMAYVLMA